MPKLRAASGSGLTTVQGPLLPQVGVGVTVRVFVGVRVLVAVRVVVGVGVSVEVVDGVGVSAPPGTPIATGCPASATPPTGSASIAHKLNPKTAASTPAASHLRALCSMVY